MQVRECVEAGFIRAHAARPMLATMVRAEQLSPDGAINLATYAGWSAINLARALELLEALMEGAGS